MQLKNPLQSPYVKYGVYLLLVILLIPHEFYSLPQPGLDPSWQIALNLAVKQQLSFGKDFIFTYGPLGVLTTRLPIGVDRWLYLLLDGYLLVTFFLVLRELGKSHFGPLTMLYIFLVTQLARYQFAHAWYFVFFLFYVCCVATYEQKKTTHLVHAAILSLIALYSKISLGFISVFIFLACLAYLGLTRKLSVRYILVAISIYVNLFLLSAAVFNVDIKGYFTSAIHIINSYNDSMLRPLMAQYLSYFYVAVGVVICWVVYSLYFLFTYLRQKNYQKDLQELFVLGAVSLFVFVLFKNGFVRGETHVTYFFKGICFALPFLYLFSSYSRLKFANAVMSWIVLIFSFVICEAVPGSYRPLQRLYTFSFIPLKYHEIKNYVNGIASYNEFKNNRPDVLKDNAFKERIGNASVDVFPSEISIAYFNDLNYQPRPIIQSYSAYDEYLDSLNASRYNSSRAPEYIIFSVSTIDDRYPNFDESRTKMAILSNYELVEEVDGALLLKRNPGTRRLEVSRSESIVANLGEDIQLPEGSQLMFSKVKVDYTATGKLKRLFYKPPSLKVTFTLNNGEQRTYTGIKPILEGGVLLNRFVDSEQEFSLLMNDHGNANSRVEKVRFDVSDGESGFQQRISLSSAFLNVVNATREGRLRDSTLYAELISRFKATPMEVSNTASDTATVQSFVENFQTHSGFFVNIMGWAFMKNEPNDNTKISVILKSTNGQHFALNTKIFERPDVSVYFNRKDIHLSGFSAVTSKANLPSGEYKLMLQLQNGTTRAIKVFEDKTFVIRKPATLEIVSSQPETLSDQTLFNIESVKNSPNEVVIQGWAFLKSATKAPNTKLFLKNGHNCLVASVDYVDRPDVAGYLKNDAAAHAGFYASLRKEKLVSGTYLIGVELRDEKGQVHRGLSDQKIVITNVSKPQRIDAAILLSKFSSSIDAVKKEGPEIAVSGWALTSSEDVLTSTTSLILKGATQVYAIKTDVDARPDVTAYFKSKQNIDRCGFSVRFRESDIAPGKYQIGVQITTADGKKQATYLEQYLTIH